MAVVLATVAALIVVTIDVDGLLRTRSATPTSATPTSVAPPAVAPPSVGSGSRDTIDDVLIPAPPGDGNPLVNPAPLRLGVTTPGGPSAPWELDEAANVFGENPSIVMWYEDFAQAPPIAKLDLVAARGATSMITWEPWVWGGGVDQPAYSSDRIAAGDYDEHLRAWGEALAAWGRPVMLRYGHEMNGSWYPWADEVNGNESGDYIAAWRHVHDVVTEAGAVNVRWVWTPNVPQKRLPTMKSVYPGDDYVDLVGLDGYNFGTSADGTTWMTPPALFDTGITRLRTIAPGKRIIIGETASSEQGGNKARWNAQLIGYLSAQRDIVAVIWFNQDKETDWRVNSSDASIAAMRAALAARPTE